MSSFTTPILTTGTSSNQPWYTVVTDNRQDVGTRGVTQDGRVFYYAVNRSSSAIPAGNLLSNSPVDVDFDDLAIATLTVGTESAAITPAGTKTYSANELVGGFMQVNSGAAGNDGRQYRILGHAATSANTEFTIEFDAIREEDFVAATTVTIVPNAYSAVTISSSVTSLCVGVTPADIPAGNTTPQFFWAQTWGLACVLSGASGDILGHTLILHTTDGASIGQIDLNGGGGAVDQPQQIGTNLFTSVSADFMPVYLTLAP